MTMPATLRPMDSRGVLDAETMAAYSPELFGNPTPRQFCERFGVPSADHWDSLRELVRLDKGGRFRSVIDVMPQRAT